MKNYSSDAWESGSLRPVDCLTFDGRCGCYRRGAILDGDGLLAPDLLFPLSFVIKRHHKTCQSNHSESHFYPFVLTLSLRPRLIILVVSGGQPLTLTLG